MILAAGYGTRLQLLSPCKPLTPVGGISLLEISIRQLAAAGASRVIVVTGHQAEAIETALVAISRSVGIGVEAVRLSDWSRPNGHSVLAGAAQIAGDYFLVMADHVFETSVLKLLAERRDHASGVTLAIDRRIDSPLIDPDDVTWVDVDDCGLIRAIGKSLLTYNAADCGAFIATPALADAIRTAIANGKAGSLSDGMQVLADHRRAATVDIGEAWWLDVDDPRALTIAEADAPLALPSVFASRNQTYHVEALQKS